MDDVTGGTTETAGPGLRPEFSAWLRVMLLAEAERLIAAQSRSGAGADVSVLAEAS